MSAPIDRAYVAIVPDFRDFNQRVKSGVHDALSSVGRDLDQINQNVRRNAEEITRSQQRMFNDVGRTVRHDLTRAVHEGGAAAARASISEGELAARGWVRGVDGRIRDATGRFVSATRLAGAGAGDEGERQGENTGRRWGRGIRQGAASGDAAISGMRQHLTALVALGTTIGVIAGNAVVGLAGMAAGAIKSGVQTAAAMEQADIAFSTLLHSATKSKDFLAQLSTFAAATPFELPGLIDASRQLLGVGVQAKDVIPTLTAYGDAAGALGLSQDNFNHIMLATTQAMSAGTLHAGDLLQMTEAGLPVWKLLSEALGKPVSELKKMSEQGKLMTADVLPKLQAQMEKDYGGAMSRQSQTLTGLWSTMMDTFHQGMAKAIIPLEPLLRKLIPGAAKVMGAALMGLSTGAQHFFTGLSGNVKRMDQSDRPKLELFGLGIHAMFQSFKSGDVTSRGFVGVMERIGVALRTARFAVVAMFAAFKGGGVTSTGFVGVMEHIGVALRSVFDFIKDTIPKVFQGLVKSITDLANVALPLVIEAWNNFKGPLTTVARVLINDIIPAITAITGFLAKHKVAVQSVVVALGTAYAIYKVVSITTAIYTGIAGAAAIATAAFGVATEELTLQQRVAIAVTKAQAAVTAALNVVMDANPIVLVVIAIAALAAGFIYAYKHSKTFRDIVDSIGRFLKRMFNDVYGFLKTWGPLLLAVLAPIVGIPLLIWQHWSQIKKFMSQAWDLVWPFLKTWGPVALAVLVPFIGIPLLIFQHFNQIKDFMARAWRAAYDTVTRWIGNVLAFVRTLPGKLIGIFARAPSWLVNAGINIIRGLWNGITRYWNNTLWPWFRSIPGWIIRTYVGAQLWLINAGLNVIRGLWSGISNRWAGVRDWFNGVQGWIRRRFSGALGWLTSSGHDILAGLWNGLRNIWNTVVGWFGKIPGWIKHALGIHSPPAWAVDAGEWIIKGLIKGLIGGSFSFGAFLGHFATLARKKLASLASSVIKSVGGLFGGGGGMGNIQLLSWILKAINITGVGTNWLQPLMRRIAFESGGNPNAINLWDSNAKMGNPSQGLMQVVPTTFRAYALPGYDNNILDPVSNIVAAIRYINSRYGSIFRIDPPVQGYAAGAWDIARDQLALLHRREMVVPAVPAQRIRDAAASGVPQAMDEAKIAAAFARALAGLTLEFDGDGLARLVTRKQNVTSAKGVRR